MALLIERFHGNGFYVLDEPEAALSPTRQMSALVRIHDLVQQGAQFIIATHSRILMAYPQAQILAIEDGELRPTAYTETEHYRVTRRFLDRHEAIMKDLLADS